MAFYNLVLPAFQGPERMTGDLNVAVAALAGTDDDEARGFSESLYRTLDDELGRADTGLDIQVRGPDSIGRIDGESAAERAASARRLARDIDADVVVYGSLEATDTGTQLRPEYWLSETKLRHPEDRVPVMGAVTVPDEPAGGQQLGAISVSGDIEALAPARARLRAQLARRTRAFAFFILGLGYYAEALGADAGSGAASALGRAERWFRAAERGDSWDPRVGAVLHLFEGNVALLQRRLPDAEAEYRIALRFDPGYVRAQLGAAETRFHRSAGDCEPRRVDRAGLAEAARGYAAVLASTDREPSVLGAKAAFGAGRVEVCRVIAGVGGSVATAGRRFQDIIAMWRGGFRPVLSQASEAYGGLGLLHLLRAEQGGGRREYQRAVDEYTEALKLSVAAQRRGIFHGVLGYLYARMHDEPAARREYDRAMRLDPERRAAYLREQRSLLD
ncbi:MAG TPA: hypothetical protein VFM58_05895 [Solirubrobacteraceae bacterium]|nr:hypothetical protein [Solirubrobacteraceae bacterium]